MTNETPLVSSAQNQEDIMLWRALRQVTDGFYIDVGAADPLEDSVTRLFYDHNWHGIDVEPNPAYGAALAVARERDVILPAAVSRACGTLAFYVVEGTGLSTLDAELAARHAAAGRTVTRLDVETLTLAEICRRHRPDGPIHFLKVDVEGAEEDVLAGADFATFRPWIVLVEAVLPNVQQPSYAAWEGLLTGQGYVFAWFDGLNRFYIDAARREELQQHFQVQPNVFDGFAPPSQLLQRLEDAEKHLHNTQNRATQLEQQLAEARLQQNTLLGRLSETGEALSATQQYLSDAKAALDQMELRAEQAEMLVDRLRRSSSWRLSAPLRALTNALRMQRPENMPAIRWAADGLTTKEVGRQVFHRGVRVALVVPGCRRAIRLGRAVAPGAIEWFGVRYRAYDQRATELQLSSTSSGETNNAILAGNLTGRLDLSDAEARIYRQLAVGGFAANPTSPKP